jgi:hypothetical protein
LTVVDDAYAAGWNGSTNVPTKNAVYDKIEALVIAGVTNFNSLSANGMVVSNQLEVLGTLLISGSGTNSLDSLWATNYLFASNVIAGAVKVDDDPYAAGWNGSTNVPTKNAVYDRVQAVAVGSVGITVDGAGSELTTGVKGYIEVPYACTITQCTMLADQSGTATINVWKDTYANYPPTSADAIGTNSISGPATKNLDSTLTGWTTAVSAGDILAFNVSAVSTIERLTVTLKVLK